MIIIIVACFFIDRVTLLLALAGRATGRLVPEADAVGLKTLSILALAAGTLLD